jgi:hypothetical protein
LRQHVAGAQAANAFGIVIKGNTAASIGRFALLFEHVPARIDASDAFVVVVQKRLAEVNRRTR